MTFILVSSRARLALASLVAGCAVWDNAPAASLAWESIPDRVRERSPELLSARLEVDEIRARLDAAGWKSGPSIGFELRPGLATGGQGSIQAAFERTLPRPERLRLEKGAVAAQIPVLEARLREREIALVAEARTAAVVLLMTPRRAELIDRQHATATELATFLAARVAAGEASPLESGQAGLDAAQAEVQRAQLRARHMEAEHRLRLLLAWPPEDPLAISGDLAIPKPVEDGTPEVPSSPSALSARAEAAQAVLEGELARASVAPEKSLGFFAEIERSEDEPEGVGNEAFIGVGLTVPLSVAGRAVAVSREAGLRARRLEAEAARLDTQATLQAASARADMEAQARIFLAAGGDPAHLAADQESRAETLLRGGQGDLSAVLRARAQRLALEDVRLDALEAHHLARVRLDAVLQR